jgi:hypothetical protein
VVVVRKLLARCAVVIGAVSVSAAALGSGVAAATPDIFAGLTYAKASEVITQLNSKVVVASVMGGQLPRDECIVTRSQRDKKNNVILYLNCNAGLASATESGNSVVSPAGREAKKNQLTADWIAADPANCKLSASIAKACEDFCNSHSELCSQGD